MLGIIPQIWRQIIFSFARLLDWRGLLYRRHQYADGRRAWPQADLSRDELMFKAGLMVRESWADAGMELRNALNDLQNGR